MSFHSLGYIRHNQRRQEHLATLSLNLDGKRVLELGAGIGDHSTFFLDRGCEVLAIEARPENCEELISSYRDSGYGHEIPLQVWCGTVEDAAAMFAEERFDVVYCYGLLYHVADPLRVLEFARKVCDGLFLLETCVSFGQHEAVNNVAEGTQYLAQAAAGQGCRPTRAWIFNRLQELFPHAYMPMTQPWHEEFLLDWTVAPAVATGLFRAVFIGACQELDNPVLLTSIPDRQRRC